MKDRRKEGSERAAAPLMMREALNATPKYEASSESELKRLTKGN
jgi:hypothetical protein